MTPWRQRLAVHAAFATVFGAALGAMAGLWVPRWFDLLTPPDGIVSPWFIDIGGTIIGAVCSVAWWAHRQTRALDQIVTMASTALAGRAIPVATDSALNESEAAVNAVRALVDRVERTTRELSQRQAYAAVGDFASELARELAPSVAAARSAIRTLEGHLHIDSPFHPPLARAQRELHRLSNTLQDTLRLARSGRLASQRLDLWLPLRAALRTVTTDATERRVWVEPPAHGRAPIWIHGDPDALEQLFLNLFINAVQATEPGGKVEVAVNEGDDATITITDTGCGIPEGALDRVFEPFYSTKPERAGLGLAIAWRTAAAHGGRLSIESALGRGTKVHVSLPVADAGSAYRLE